MQGYCGAVKMLTGASCELFYEFWNLIWEPSWLILNAIEANREL